MSIKLNLNGFEDLLRKIEKAGASVEKVTTSCLKTSAKIMETELKAEMRRSNIDESIISAIPPYEVENTFGKITARVGYRKGEYNPKKLSLGYKVMFMNYGTPHREKHGIEGSAKKSKRNPKGTKFKIGFVQRAKNKAGTKIEKQQQEALENILKGLKK